ncbi:MAG: thioredoxin domain-containing protein [Candidatus Diapherotrites archaeon]
MSKFKRPKTEEEKPLKIWNYIPLAVIVVIIAAIYITFTTPKFVDLTPYIENEPTLGPQDAKVTIVEFSDFECPFCADAAATVRQVVNEYDGKVKLVYKNFPIVSIHPNSMAAAEASECAYDQGKFWEYHNKLFENQENLGVASLRQYAADIGMNEGQFVDCLGSGSKNSEVNEDLSHGKIVGISGTPAFFINGKKMPNSSINTFRSMINQELG